MIAVSLSTSPIHPVPLKSAREKFYDGLNAVLFATPKTKIIYPGKKYVMKAIAEYNKEEWSEVQPLGKLYFELGKTLYRLQDYEKATEALKQSLQTKDDSVDE